MYRTPPDVENADFYPVAVSRSSVTPGAVFYDPGGHVLVVAEVHDDGDLDFLDGHPDGALTWTRFDGGFEPGPPSLGGGFKRFRPLARGEGAPVRAQNRALRDLDQHAQWDPAAWIVDGKRDSYAHWVRAALRAPGVAADPIADVREAIAALCRKAAERAVAVELAVTDGISDRPHP